MLTPSDATTVRTWLADALNKQAAAGKSAAGLAQFCGVSRQAVNGWLHTGRITKSNLSRAALYLGMTLPFNQPHVVQEPPALYNRPPRPPWPFPGISEQAVCDLPRDVRLRLEAALMMFSLQFGFPLKPSESPTEY